MRYGVGVEAAQDEGWWSQVPDGGRTRTRTRTRTIQGESTDIQEADGVNVETTFGRPLELINYYYQITRNRPSWQAMTNGRAGNA